MLIWKEVLHPIVDHYTDENNDPVYELDPVTNEIVYQTKYETSVTLTKFQKIKLEITPKNNPFTNKTFFWLRVEIGSFGDQWNDWNFQDTLENAKITCTKKLKEFLDEILSNVNQAIESL